MRPALLLAALLLALPGCIIRSDRGYGRHALPDGSMVSGGPHEKAACDFHQARGVPDWTERAWYVHDLGRAVDRAEDERSPKRYADALVALGAELANLTAATNRAPTK